MRFDLIWHGRFTSGLNCIITWGKSFALQQYCKDWMKLQSSQAIWGFVKSQETEMLNEGLTVLVPTRGILLNYWLKSISVSMSVHIYTASYACWLSDKAWVTKTFESSFSNERYIQQTERRRCNKRPHKRATRPARQMQTDSSTVLILERTPEMLNHLAPWNVIIWSSI